MKILVTICILFASLTANAQKTFLKITQGGEVVYYPPGTQFDLKNPHGYIILKYSETPRVEKIDGNYKLIVSPNWKSKNDVFKLTQGDQVELVLNKNFGKVKRSPKAIYINQNQIVAHKDLTDSEKFPGKKNLVFTLSNGIKFVYEDGKYYAKLRTKYVDIKGKYVIETRKGILRLSFNPNNGVVWWVFEKSK